MIASRRSIVGTKWIVLLLLLGQGNTQNQDLDNYPEDDEDILTTATFSLEFTISRSCEESWYPPNIFFLSTAIVDTIVEGINEDCFSCNFASRNLQDSLSCGNTTVSFHATVRNWFSTTFPSVSIRDSINARYNTTNVTSISLSTDEFVAPFNGTLELTVLRVFSDLIRVAGSGDDGYTDDVTTGTDPLTTTLGTATTTTTNNTLENVTTSGIPTSGACSMMRVSTVMATMTLVAAAAVVMGMIVG